jgi:hypothetical protein
MAEQDWSARTSLMTANKSSFDAARSIRFERERAEVHGENCDRARAAERRQKSLSGWRAATY